MKIIKDRMYKYTGPAKSRAGSILIIPKNYDVHQYYLIYSARDKDMRILTDPTVVSSQINAGFWKEIEFNVLDLVSGVIND